MNPKGKGPKRAPQTKMENKAEYMATIVLAY